MTEGIVKVGERLASVCNDSLKLGLQDTYRLGVLRETSPLLLVLKTRELKFFHPYISTIAVWI